MSYQLFSGSFDAAIGAVVAIAPNYATHVARMHVSPDAIQFISIVGAGFFSLGLAGLCGAFMMYRRVCVERMETVWLLTAIMRTGTAVLIGEHGAAGNLGRAWLIFALCNVVPVLIQGIGLHNCWLERASASPSYSNTKIFEINQNARSIPNHDFTNCRPSVIANRHSHDS